MASLLGQSNIDWLTTTSFHYAATANRPWNMAAVIPDNYIPVTEEDGQQTCHWESEIKQLKNPQEHM